MRVLIPRWTKKKRWAEEATCGNCHALLRVFKSDLFLVFEEDSNLFSYREQAKLGRSYVCFKCLQCDRISDMEMNKVPGHFLETLPSKVVWFARSKDEEDEEN